MVMYRRQKIGDRWKEQKLERETRNRKQRAIMKNRTKRYGYQDTGSKTRNTGQKERG